MSQVTTHILDTSRGKPATGISVRLYQAPAGGSNWDEIASGITNQDGRVPDLLKKEHVLEKGSYKLRFEIKPYFDKAGVETFYPFIEIVFNIGSGEHYHVPLLLNPFGYSTYRGS